MEKVEKIIGSIVCEFSWKNEILSIIIRKKGILIHIVDINEMVLNDVPKFIESFTKEDLCLLVNENVIQL